VDPLRILALQSDTGSGHRQAAAAVVAEIVEALGKATADEKATEAIIVDAFVDLHVPILRRSPRIYDALSNRGVGLYNFGWRVSNAAFIRGWLAERVGNSISRRLANLLAEVNPSVAAVTHPLYLSAATCVARERASLSFPILTIVTDLVNPHSSWGSGWPDELLVTTTEAEARLKSYGIRTQIRRVKFPLTPEYRSAVVSPSTGRELLGMPEKTTLLVTGGGAGSGGMVRLTRELSIKLDVNLIVACGSNRGAYSALRRSPWTRTVLPVGPSSSLKEYYDAADYVVGKAGPATVFESAARNRGLLVTSEVGAQEKGNAAYVQRAGLGIDCTADWGRVVEAVRTGWSPSPRCDDAELPTSGRVITDLLGMTGTVAQG
jgi:hypothetical protein